MYIKSLHIYTHTHVLYIKQLVAFTKSLDVLFNLLSGKQLLGKFINFFIF